MLQSRFLGIQSCLTYRSVVLYLVCGTVLTIPLISVCAWYSKYRQGLVDDTFETSHLTADWVTGSKGWESESNDWEVGSNKWEPRSKTWEAGAQDWEQGSTYFEPGSNEWEARSLEADNEVLETMSEGGEQWSNDWEAGSHVPGPFFFSGMEEDEVVAVADEELGAEVIEEKERAGNNGYLEVGQEELQEQQENQEQKEQREQKEQNELDPQKLEKYSTMMEIIKKLEKQKMKNRREVGKVFYSNGDTYRGWLVDETPHGSGTMEYSDGSFYNGEWNMGQRDGEGVYIERSGDIVSEYTGTWRNDRRTFSGRAVYSNNDIYEGGWNADMFYGEGVFKWNLGVYKGTFLYGLMDGYGVMYFPDGSRFSGEWRSGKPIGKGNFTSVYGVCSKVKWTVNEGPVLYGDCSANSASSAK